MNTAASEIKSHPLPLNHFDESIGLDDPRPSASWEPSPDQIRRWSEQIRDEREELRRESG